MIDSFLTFFKFQIVEWHSPSNMVSEKRLERRHHPLWQRQRFRQQDFPRSRLPHLPQQVKGQKRNSPGGGEKRRPYEDLETYLHREGDDREGRNGEFHFIGKKTRDPGFAQPSRLLLSENGIFRKTGTNRRQDEPLSSRGPDKDLPTSSDWRSSAQRRASLKEIFEINERPGGPLSSLDSSSISGHQIFGEGYIDSIVGNRYKEKRTRHLWGRKSSRQSIMWTSLDGRFQTRQPQRSRHYRHTGSHGQLKISQQRRSSLSTL